MGVMTLADAGALVSVGFQRALLEARAAATAHGSAQKFAQMDLDIATQCSEDMQVFESCRHFDVRHKLPKCWPPQDGYSEALDGWLANKGCKEWLKSSETGIFFHVSTM